MSQTKAAQQVMNKPFGGLNSNPGSNSNSNNNNNNHEPDDAWSNGSSSTTSTSSSNSQSNQSATSLQVNAFRPQPSDNNSLNWSNNVSGKLVGPDLWSDSQTTQQNHMKHFNHMDEFIAQNESQKMKNNFKTKWSHDNAVNSSSQSSHENQQNNQRINNYNSNNDLINDTWNPFLSNPIASAVNSTNSANSDNHVNSNHLPHSLHQHQHPQQSSNPQHLANHQHLQASNTNSHNAHHNFNNQWSQQSIDSRQVSLTRLFLRAEKIIFTKLGIK